MHKKSQVTVFVIIGIVILVMAGFVIMLLRDGSKEPDINVPAKVKETGSNVESFVETCLKETGEKGLLVLGLQGGLYELPDNYFEMEYGDVPYFYYQGDIRQVPSIDMVIQNLERYIDENIGYCIGGLEEYRKQNYSVGIGEPKTRILKAKDKLIAELELPITMDKDGLRSRHSQYEAEYALRLDDMFNIMNEILTQTIIDPYSIYHSLLLDLIDRYGVQIDTLTNDEDSVVYVVQDPKSIIGDGPFMLLFATGFNNTNIPPEFINIDSEMTATVGEEFYYGIEAYDREGGWLEYDTDSQIFGIGPYSGDINFTPEAEDVGEHYINVSVSDGEDETFYLIHFRVVG